MTSEAQLRNRRHKVIPACGEDHEGPLLLGKTPSALDIAPRSTSVHGRWGDEYDDALGVALDGPLAGGAPRAVTQTAACGPASASTATATALKKGSNLWGDPVGDQVDWLHFGIGDPVQLHGLSATLGLNGRRGTIVRLVPETSHVAVMLEGGFGLKAVEPNNLRLDNCDEGAWGAGEEMSACLLYTSDAADE